MNQQPMHEDIESDIFFGIIKHSSQHSLNQPLEQLPFNGVDVMINKTGILFVIRFEITCIVYSV